MNPPRALPVLLGAVAILLLATGAASAQVELSPEVFEIASLLRCPVCISESVAQSASPTAEEMRLLISQRLDAGATETEILAYFQERYGDWILLEPARRGIYLVVWILPVVVAAAVLVAAIVLVRRWARRGREPVEVDPAFLARVHRESVEEGSR